MSTKLKLISWQIIRNIIPAFVYRKEKHSFVSGTVPVQEHTETHSVTRGTRDRERPRTLEHMGFRISHAGYAISRPAPSYIAMGREREREEREGGGGGGGVKSRSFLTLLYVYLRFATVGLTTPFRCRI